MTTTYLLEGMVTGAASDRSQHTDTEYQKHYMPPLLRPQNLRGSHPLFLVQILPHISWIFHPLTHIERLAALQASAANRSDV